MDGGQTGTQSITSKLTSGLNPAKFSAVIRNAANTKTHANAMQKCKEGNAMRKLSVGETVYLNDGDSGEVVEVLSGGYELLMESTGKYHGINDDGSCGMFGHHINHAVDIGRLGEGATS